MIVTACSILDVAEKKNKYAQYYVGIGTIINTILNALVIPVFGISCVADLMLISEIVVAIIAPYFFTPCNIY